MSKNNKIILFLYLVIFSLTCLADAGKDGGHALIIIDMQTHFIERNGKHRNEKNTKKIETIIDTQIKAIEMAKKSGIPVVFIEYENYGATDERLKKAASGYAKVKYFPKIMAGMFSSTSVHQARLEEYLEKEKIKTLIVTGTNGGACVFESIEGAIYKNFNVVAFSKGIADFNYRDFIYPYKNRYNFKPRCENCTFREVDELSEVNLIMLNNNGKDSREQINDSSRRFGQSEKISHPEDSAENPNKKAATTAQ